MNRELQELLIKQQREETFHTPLENEFIYYRRIAQGDLSILENENVELTQGMGQLSENPLRNLKYHTIILVAMITRFCVEEGLDSEMAYTMSDLFISEIDRAETEDALMRLRHKIISQYIHTMNTDKKKGYSLPVTKATEYIRNHLTEPLSNTQVAEYVSCTADYLSRLFKKETGLTLSRYILEQKCHIACYMLEHSGSSCTDISAFLSFASCSYFISRFRLVHGVTPQEYRKQHMRNTISSFGGSR